MVNNDITGILLTGGKSSRFKSDKAFAKYDNESFYQKSLQLIESITDRVYLVKRLEQQITVESAKISVITDIEQFMGAGPLAGIYSAMEKGSSEWFLVLPVDTPLMNEAILSRIIKCSNNNYEAVIPRVNGKCQPLIGMYHANVIQVILQQLQNNQLSMHQLLAKLAVKYLDFSSEEEHFFANINTEEDYQYYLRD
ncbi:molybdenum cofactor guanylyltransferase [Gracilibacillus massiliensis]|uniref:molybdenum cofactor guanylyltransferase n=1 Tax=Gracilibacillus massiliensis TaxID=1564956 RepID=UPI00071D090C|nr:molybdenum cofactor guanylyltransferase [Gracilibacillus massiliensis]